jgi:hypothetical protein
MSLSHQRWINLPSPLAIEMVFACHQSTTTSPHNRQEQESHCLFALLLDVSLSRKISPSPCVGLKLQWLRAQNIVHELIGIRIRFRFNGSLLRLIHSIQQSIDVSYSTTCIRLEFLLWRSREFGNALFALFLDGDLPVTSRSHGEAWGGLRESAAALMKEEPMLAMSFKLIFRKIDIPKLIFLN